MQATESCREQALIGHWRKHTMINYWSIALGGAIGAMARFWVYNASLAWGGARFPYATLVVNVIGSLLIGVLYVLFTERAQLPATWKPILVTGFLGAFTTFSTFSLETMQLLQGGRPGLALVNVALSVILCLLAAWGGLSLARNLI